MFSYRKFEELVRKNGVTAYAVSKATGIPSSTFSDWKKGKSKPKIEKLQKIAKYFDVSVSYFLPWYQYEMRCVQMIVTTLR